MVEYSSRMNNLYRGSGNSSYSSSTRGNESSYSPGMGCSGCCIPCTGRCGRS